MITGPELIASLKAMSNEELIEVSRIIIVGRDWKAREDKAPDNGLRGHQRFVAGLSHEQREQWERNCLR
jgi:hypothetical protein